MTRVEVIEEAGSHRLIRSDQGSYAVVEARDGKVAPVTPGDQRTADDSPQGMAAAAAGSWTDERAARKAFDAAVRTGERYARRIW